MFKNLRQGNPFYILHKGDKPYCEVGQVISVSGVRPKTPYPNTYPMPQQVEMVVDIKVKIGDDNVGLPSVPADLLITDYKPDNSQERMVLACDANSISTEVNSMLANSQQILGSIDTHKGIIESCEGILTQLNPQFARGKEQEEKIAMLENMIVALETKLGGIDDLKSMIVTLVEQKQTTKKTTT